MSSILTKFDHGTYLILFVVIATEKNKTYLTLDFDLIGWGHDQRNTTSRYKDAGESIRAGLLRWSRMFKENISLIIIIVIIITHSNTKEI